MSENIQALIDLLSQEILKYDLSHIKGEEIVSGNAEHCINLLQLVHEISLMIADKAEGEEGEEAEGDAEVEGPAVGEWPPKDRLAHAKFEDRYFQHGENLRGKFNEIELDSFMKLLNVKPHK